MGIAVMYGRRSKGFGLWRRGQTMEVIYKSRHIHSVPELNLETDSWIPNADVSWEGRTKCHQLLTGPIGYFKIIEEAEIYAVEMAKTWIDANHAEQITDWKRAK